MIEISSSDPKSPSSPKLVNVTPLTLNKLSSIASLKFMVIVEISRGRPPSPGLLPATTGPKVSGVISRVRTSDKRLLPPVSVARTWISAVVPSGSSERAMALKSKGKDTSLPTTSPLTNNSTLRTCTSSVTST